MVRRSPLRHKDVGFSRRAASGPDRPTGIVRLPLRFPNRDQCGLQCGNGCRSWPSPPGNKGLLAADTAEGLSANPLSAQQKPCWHGGTSSGAWDLVAKLAVLIADRENPISGQKPRYSPGLQFAETPFCR